MWYVYAVRMVYYTYCLSTVYKTCFLASDELTGSRHSQKSLSLLVERRANNDNNVVQLANVFAFCNVGRVVAFLASGEAAVLVVQLQIASNRRTTTVRARVSMRPRRMPWKIDDRPASVFGKKGGKAHRNVYFLLFSIRYYQLHTKYTLLLIGAHVKSRPVVNVQKYIIIMLPHQTRSRC